MSKLMGFRSDGAFNMEGKKTGLVTLIQNLHPEIIGIHCLAYAKSYCDCMWTLTYLSYHWFEICLRIPLLHSFVVRFFQPTVQHIHILHNVCGWKIHSLCEKMFPFWKERFHRQKKVRLQLFLISIKASNIFQFLPQAFLWNWI